MREILAIVIAISSFTGSDAGAAIPTGPFGQSKLLAPASPAPAPIAPAAGAPTAGASSAVATAKGDTTLSLTCADLRRAALRMSVHASNIANRSTTRTPEGGPYVRQEVICKVAGAFCNIEKATDEPRLEYQPGHPDANPQGYVKYPSINVDSEMAGLNNAVAEIKLLASREICGAKIIEQGSISIVKYNPDFDVMMDTLSFNSSGSLARWSRTTRDGKTQNLAFKADGLPTSL